MLSFNARHGGGAVVEVGPFEIENYDSLSLSSKKKICHWCLTDLSKGPNLISCRLVDPIEWITVVSTIADGIGVSISYNYANRGLRQWY